MKTLFDLVKGISGKQTAEIVYSASCRLSKESGYASATKRVSLKVLINANYETEVRSRIAENGGNANSFTSDGLNWGVWELTDKVILNKGKRYLRYYCINGEFPQVEFFVNGVPATAQQTADIKALLASKNKSSEKQSASGLNGNDQVMPRNVEFSNIESLTLENGEVWVKGQSAAA